MASIQSSLQVTLYVKTPDIYDMLNSYLGERYCLGNCLEELRKKVINAGLKDGCEYLCLVPSAAIS
jgi:hypothetical protein